MDCIDTNVFLILYRIFPLEVKYEGINFLS